MDAIFIEHYLDWLGFLATTVLNIRSVPCRLFISKYARNMFVTAESEEQQKFENIFNDLQKR